jgi:hypothetical protein
MRFLGIYKHNRLESVPLHPGRDRPMGGLIEEFTKKSALLSTEGCLPSALGVRVRLSDEKFHRD